MSELERNLITFQNLCVIATRDGEISEGEMSVLAETAERLNIPAREFWKKILRAKQLNFIIPQGEDEQKKQLRMIVLVVISDGEITDKEYEGCIELSEKMEIDRSYVDTIINYYLVQQQERLKRMSIYQNLYLIAISDGNIAEEEAVFLAGIASHMGLSQGETDHIHHNHHDLELVIPDDKEERYYALRNIVFMMLADGEIENVEYQLCLDYAKNTGFSQEDLDAIITEYREKREEDIQAIDKEVSIIDFYLDTFNAFNKLDLAVPETVEHIEEIIYGGKFHRIVLNDVNDNLTFYHFVWLLGVRALQIDEAFMLPVHLDLASKHNSFRDVQNYLINQEQEKGNPEDYIQVLNTTAVQTELKAYYDDLQFTDEE